MFECKACSVKDIIIRKLEAREEKPCPICVSKDAMIARLVSDNQQKDNQIAEYKREYKRAMDRLLVEKGIQPLREEVAGEKTVDVATLMNMFEEVPIGEAK